SGCVEDGVRDGGGGERDRGFSGAGCRGFGRLHDDDFDFGHFVAEIEHRVADPIGGSDVARIPLHLFNEGAAHALEDAAFRLVAETVGIGDGAGVDGDDKAFRPDFASLLVYVDIGDHGGVAVAAFVVHTGEAAAGSLLRPGSFCGGLQDSNEARVFEVL